MAQNAAMHRHIGLVIFAIMMGMVVMPSSTAFSQDRHSRNKSDNQPAYPFKDLPGVQAGPSAKDEEQYHCRSDVKPVRRQGDEIFRSGGMPTLIYRCERDGLVIEGNRIPLRGHYQPVH